MEARMATVYLIFALVIAVIAVIFALQNTMTVTISFLAWKVTGSLSLVLLVTLAIGAVIGLLVLAPSTIRHTLAASGHLKRLSALEKELEEHKAKVAELQKPKPVPPSVETSKPAMPSSDAPQPQ
jgi:putative membrane protein